MIIKTLSELKKDVPKEAVLKLADVYIESIYEDNYSYSGCETCDFGSEYGMEYTFYFSDGTHFDLKIGEMYESPVSEGDMMVFMLNNVEEFSKMTKDEFIAYISKTENVLGY